MPKITYVEHDGKRHEVDVPESYSVMEGAVQNGIPGIDADCSGACACATCHVYIDAEWTEQVGPAEGEEDEMLDVTEERRANSRLSCQIKVSAMLDGLIVTMPETQG